MKVQVYAVLSGNELRTFRKSIMRLPSGFSSSFYQPQRRYISDDLDILCFNVIILSEHIVWFY